MKMRLRPLRGQTYFNETFGAVIFLEVVHGRAKVLMPNNITTMVNLDTLGLPIIDTKDYERIPEDKKHGE